MKSEIFKNSQRIYQRSYTVYLVSYSDNDPIVLSIYPGGFAQTTNRLILELPSQVYNQQNCRFLHVIIARTTGETNGNLVYIKESIIWEAKTIMTYKSLAARQS